VRTAPPSHTPRYATDMKQIRNLYQKNDVCLAVRVALTFHAY